MSKLRLGMIGGGEGAFIGGVHRMAARLDGAFELVAGALSSDPDRAHRSGAALGLDPTRSYGTWQEMIAAENARPDGVQAIAIVTPNHMHAAPAAACLTAGIHVICDKPLSATMDDAAMLATAAAHSDALFILTHNYTGYPLIRQARAMIEAGELGDIRLVQVEYAQGWLAEPLENTGQKQAAWRTDPAQSGGGAIGDIGTHAFNLMRFVSGLKVKELAADMSSMVAGRRVDDNVQVMLRLTGGARGSLWASQVAAGEENNLRLRIYGSKAGMEWAQENPNQLWISPLNAPRYCMTRGGAGLHAASTRVTRIPAGHPEGYLEGFATIYAEAAAAIIAHIAGVAPDAAVCFPTLDDGLEGMRFIAACKASTAQNSGWVSM
jgi:predicted dehydrogenase